MTAPFKSIEQYTYSEVVYRDADGNEVARERNYDDAWYDTLEAHVELTEDEIEDYYPEEEN